MSYSEDEKVHAAAWKQRTGALPAEAKVPACYIDQNGNSKARPVEFCLPAPYAALSLLPEVRAQALALFAELGIPWHAGVDGGPSNHLVSSQVQCVNALGQMVSDPERIRRAFGHVLGIDEVLRIEPGRYLTFEYIGPADFFGEVPGGDRIRGAHCTSVDAAFLHRAVDGVIELVLVEWKYTESYRVRKPSPAKDAVRLNRYGQAVNDPTGPIRGELLPFELLLDEPIYQLVRQQLLAHALEQAGAEGAGRVRVVHVLSPDNGAYQKPIARPEQLALGGTVAEIWHKLLRHPDRFVSVDSKLFLDPEITSREYVLRHARDVVHDQDELLSAFDLARSGDLEDILCTDHEYDGNVRVDQHGVEFIFGREGTRFSYPFTITELRELVEELAAGQG